MKKTFIAGPCVIESAELLDTVAAKLVEINKKLGTDIIFKASFDKANRTSIRSFRGPGIDRGLQMLNDVKRNMVCDCSQTFTKRGRQSLLARWWMCCRFRLFYADRQTCSLQQLALGRPLTSRKRSF